jgi:hypothetical protein
MSSAINTDRKPIAAFVGIDWADKKHDIELCAAAGNTQFDHRRIDSQPEALIEWASEMQGRFGSQGRILVCLEQSRGTLIYFKWAMGVSTHPIIPNNSAVTAHSGLSGAKDDPVDGKLLASHQSSSKLRLWRPDDENPKIGL